MDITIEQGIEMNDGHRIPRIAFGTYGLEGTDATEAVELAINAGYRHIDCARFYGNEKEVGVALAQTSVPRSELFVTSKVWNDRQLDGTVRESVEESLADLQLDCLDLLLIHWPVADRFVDTWKIFEQLRDEGLVRSVGVSNFQVEHLEKLRAAGGATPAVDQMERHPYLQDNETLAYCRDHGIVYEAWSPLGRGGCLQDETIAAIAKDHDASPAQVILAWHVQQGIIPLPRSKNPGRIRANAQMIAEPLTDAEMAAIDALDTGKPIVEGVDPQHFAESLNSLSSHF
jgi:diketogulonate reductase-like aldo/keto reductase